MIAKPDGWFAPHDPQRRIGSLVDVGATEAKVNLSDAGSGAEGWHLGNRIPGGEVNEFVFIDTGRLTLLGRLVKVWLESGERLSVDGLDDSIPENNPIGTVQILVSVDAETGYNHRGIKHYPRLGAQVYSAHPTLVSLLAQGDLSEELDQLSFPVATMPGDDSVSIQVTPEKLFSRHCAILGSTGGGKSFSMSSLIEQVIGSGGKALLIDATGEYSALPMLHYQVGAAAGSSHVNPVTYPHWMFTESDIRALLRPSAQRQAPKLNAAIQSLKLAHYHGYYPQAGVTVETNGTIKKAGVTKQPIESAIQHMSSVAAQTAWRFSSLSNQIVEECVWPTGGTAQRPINTIWGGKADNDVGHCLNLIARIETLSGSENYRWMVDCDPAQQTVPAVLDALCASDSPSAVRLDLSAVPFEANSREVLVNAIGRKLLSLARSGAISDSKPLLVFIDESHQFLNKRIGDESASINLDAFGNIAKEGRKYGLNVCIATQRPRDIPEDVLSQIGTLIVHRLTNQSDQDVVRRAVGSIDHRSAAFLPTLGQGEALLLGVDFPFPMTVKMKRPTAEPVSRSASFSSAWTAAKNAAAQAQTSSPIPPPPPLGN